MGRACLLALLAAAARCAQAMDARTVLSPSGVGPAMLPPWYRTPLAWFLGGLAVTMVVWVLLEMRTRSLVRRRRELELLVAERTTQLRHEKMELAKAREELQLQATHDSLTGLWNRAAILDQLEREVARARRAGAMLTVVLADLDFFKLVNDRYGHLCGDRVLREAAQRMQSCLRDYDAIGRYGGEEFLILMPGCDPVLSAGRLDDLVASINGRLFRDGEAELRITSSFGATVFRPEHPLRSIEELLVAADDALYRAKAAGRNRALFAAVGEDLISRSEIQGKTSDSVSC